jgi:hypothetical protein
MAASAVIVHRIPGRARLLLRERRGDPAYFSELSESIRRFENVQSARSNPTTGSITLEFIGDLETLLKQAEESDLFTITESVLPQRRASSLVGARAYSINLVSGREVNRMFMVGSVLVVVGVIQTIRGEWFPPAVSVFWMAAQAFRMATGRQVLVDSSASAG